jgi:hypothetical protein
VYSDDFLPINWLFSFRVYRGGNDDHRAIALKAEKRVFRMKVLDVVNGSRAAVAQHLFASRDHALCPLVKLAGSVEPSVAPKGLPFIIVALASRHALLCPVVGYWYTWEEECRCQTVLVAAMVWICQQPACLVVVLYKISESAHVRKQHCILLISASAATSNAGKIRIQLPKFTNWIQYEFFHLASLVSENFCSYPAVGFNTELSSTRSSTTLPTGQYAHLLDIFHAASIQKGATNRVE